MKKINVVEGVKKNWKKIVVGGLGTAAVVGLGLVVKNLLGDDEQELPNTDNAQTVDYQEVPTEE